MVGRQFLTGAASLLALASTTSAYLGASLGHRNPFAKRGVSPPPATGVKYIHRPNNVTIAYKEPGKEGICETTHGVNSYAGYVELAPEVNVFFWFFESRRNPSKDPLTLWLNGGPGSDSLIGLFQELGPCNVSADLKTHLNPYSWNEISNLLFISQPVGVGFSYGEQVLGSQNPVTGSIRNASVAPPDGVYSVEDALATDTTDLAAIATWHVLQGFLDALPQLDPRVGPVKSKEFNLWTESYGGHYGPSFFNYFNEQNKKISEGSCEGTYLNFNTLGIGNGIIDEYIQAPYYPEMANHNTYGIKAVNDTVYDYMKFACYMPNGCLDQITYCREANVTDNNQAVICSEAQDMCRDNVEGPYYTFSGKGTYDIRHPAEDPTPPETFIEYLNQAHVQSALGVTLNYTETNYDVFLAFSGVGDQVYGQFIHDIEHLLNEGVRVSLYYGDADYICNWFGGQAISLAVNYKHSKQFAKAGYAPFMVDGKEYGEVRQYGNFSFLRVYEAGHEVPFYQPLASLELFNRTINHKDIATGDKEVTGDYSSPGEATATHTEPGITLAPTSSATGTSAPVPGGPQPQYQAHRERALKKRSVWGRKFLSLW